MFIWNDSSQAPLPYQTITYKNSHTLPAGGCVLLGVITRTFLLFSSLSQFIFVRKINAVAVRFWRSEVDRLQKMRGGAGQTQRQHASTGPPDSA